VRPDHDATAVIRHCLPGDARVYLTFDDGPDPAWTPRVLDVLDRADARATFFVIGRAARASSALLRRIRTQGHEIGNHTYSHRHPWMMSTAVARGEVRDGAAAIADAIGEPPRLFRPPFGRMRAVMTEEARTGGQRPVLWSLSAIDWGPLGREQGIARRLDRVATGDVVLMHDGRNRRNCPEETLRVLPGFLSRLDSRGLVPALLPAALAMRS
jgi:peptidoglycan/xylan/chitin deacetylase (PgdA/CDA1 family)